MFGSKKRKVVRRKKHNKETNNVAIVGVERKDNHCPENIISTISLQVEELHRYLENPTVSSNPFLRQGILHVPF